MKRAVRAHREVLSPALADALLAVSGQDGVPLSVKLKRVLTELAEVVANANNLLKTSPLTPLVAREAVRQLGRRWDATILVDSNGSVYLEFGQVEGTGVGEGDKREWATQFPSLQALRAAADKLGIDTAPMGRSKKQIVAALRAAKSKLAEGAVTPKRTKTAPAVLPPVVVTLDTQTGQVQPAPPPPVVQVPSPPATPPKKLGGKTLSEIAAAADEEVNIDFILAKPAPPVPSE